MKTDSELIKEYLDNGGKVEVLPEGEYETKHVVGSITKKIPDLKTLPEAQLLYSKKQVKKKKKKEIDHSDIDMNLIPENIRELIKQKATKEELLETNKNFRSTETSNKS